MSDHELDALIETARFIVCGYAFSLRDDGLISILNLNHPDCAMLVDHDGELIETNMDQIEQQIVLSLCKKNLQFMED